MRNKYVNFEILSRDSLNQSENINLDKKSIFD